ncbi:PREDICTED: early endosome antigen 1-like, partial [Leptosomus discolor]|uniref:early endosome antigen 1-like n=1 Tax=Leptosomus discolor TaxID=188344 RepID=UPI000522DD2A
NVSLPPISASLSVCLQWTFWDNIHAAKPQVCKSGAQVAYSQPNPFSQEVKRDQSTEEKLVLAQEELVSSRNRIASNNQQIQELKKAKSTLEQDASKKEQQLGEKTKMLQDLQNDREVANLKDAKQLLIQQKLELQGKIDNMNSALEQEKKTHQAVKDQLKKREEELKKECAEIEAKLVTALNENLATMKKEWQSSQRRVSELEKQTDDLRGDIAVLEATVQNNQDERRALLERCIKSEGEIEKLQAKLVEMKKKLDNTTAAMQELGRENQSLQIKHTQALNRKWAEDNEVQNCMACGKGFSVTVRRHHCRQCGNIFCAECSAKNALTPSSKKPVRVCDTCFNDLQG